MLQTNYIGPPPALVPPVQGHTRHIASPSMVMTGEWGPLLLRPTLRKVWERLSRENLVQEDPTSHQWTVELPYGFSTPPAWERWLSGVARRIFGASWIEKKSFASKKEAMLYVKKRYNLTGQPTRAQLCADMSKAVNATGQPSDLQIPFGICGQNPFPVPPSWTPPVSSDCCVTSVQVCKAGQLTVEFIRAHPTNTTTVDPIEFLESAFSGTNCSVTTTSMLPFTKADGEAITSCRKLADCTSDPETLRLILVMGVPMVLCLVGAVATCFLDCRNPPSPHDSSESNPPLQSVEIHPDSPD